MMNYLLCHVFFDGFFGLFKLAKELESLPELLGLLVLGIHQRAGNSPQSSSGQVLAWWSNTKIYVNKSNDATFFQRQILLTQSLSIKLS